MTTELSVEQRVELHAALADSTRLRIVDHLADGDASAKGAPGGAATSPRTCSPTTSACSSDAGVWSVAARRPTAPRLSAAAARGRSRSLPRGATAVPRVVFVCTPNSARSQLAAALWARAADVPVASAGTHPARKPAPGAVRRAPTRAQARGQAARTPRRRARPDDLVITVCDNAYEELTGPRRPRGCTGRCPTRCRSDTDAAFDAAYNELADRVDPSRPGLTAS